MLTSSSSKISWSPKNAHASCEIGASLVTVAENGVPYGVWQCTAETTSGRASCRGA